MIPLICIRINSQNTSQPTGGKNFLIQSFTLTPRSATHCTHYEQTTLPQTFSTTPPDCAHSPRRAPSISQLQPIFQSIYLSNSLKRQLCCVSTPTVEIQHNLAYSNRSRGTAAQPVGKTLHHHTFSLSYIFDWSVPLSASPKARTVSGISRKRLSTSKKRRQDE